MQFWIRLLCMALNFLPENKTCDICGVKTPTFQSSTLKVSVVEYQPLDRGPDESLDSIALRNLDVYERLVRNAKDRLVKDALKMGLQRLALYIFFSSK